MDSRLSGPGLSSVGVTVLCSWAIHLTLTVPLSTKEYIWVPANRQGNLTNILGVPTCDGLLASHLGVGGGGGGGGGGVVIFIKS